MRFIKWSLVSILILITSLSSTSFASEQIDLPITIIDQEPYINLKINGESELFLFDTGAISTLLSLRPPVQKKLGLTPLKQSLSFPNAFNCKKLKFYQTQVNTLQLGKEIFNNPPKAYLWGGEWGDCENARCDRDGTLGQGKII